MFLEIAVFNYFILLRKFFERGGALKISQYIKSARCEMAAGSDRTALTCHLDMPLALFHAAAPLHLPVVNWNLKSRTVDSRTELELCRCQRFCFQLPVHFALSSHALAFAWVYFFICYFFYCLPCPAVSAVPHDTCHTMPHPQPRQSLTLYQKFVNKALMRMAKTMGKKGINMLGDDICIYIDSWIFL